MNITIDRSDLDLLLHAKLFTSDVDEVLARIGFSETRAAARCLVRIAESQSLRPELRQFLPHLMTALGSAANPDSALVSFDRFSQCFSDRRILFRALATDPRLVEQLVTIFAGSQFLSGIMMRHPDYLGRLAERRTLKQLKSMGEFYKQAQDVAFPFHELLDIGTRQPSELLDALRKFQRWEQLRIGACDLLDLFDMPTATSQLSCLAESLVRVCLDLAAHRTGTSMDSFVVLALGKLGGEELNYSSDIDLIFICRGDSSEYNELGECLIDSLERVTDEGFLYRVDMRLRPWGRVGQLVSNLDGHIVYLREHALLWERQALLKARVLAGSETLGNEFMVGVEHLLFSSSREEVQASVHDMKTRTEQYLRRSNRVWGEVKLGEGSIRDIEFVTQYLQLVHGAGRPDVRSRGTLDALGRLSEHGLLSSEEYRILTEGYSFLRTVEHHLQMMHYRKTHTLPTDEEALSRLAQRLRFQSSGAREMFLARYHQHSIAIRAVYLRYLDSDHVAESELVTISPTASDLGPDVQHHLARMASSYSATFTESEIKMHAMMASQLGADNLVEVHASPLGEGRWRVTVVGYDYLGKLSQICGMLFVYGLDIVDGHVFTYESHAAANLKPGEITEVSQRRQEGTVSRKSFGDYEKKNVDVFTVQTGLEHFSQETWERYTSDLASMLGILRQGDRGQASGALAKLAAGVLDYATGEIGPLYPVDIEIDNKTSDRHTVLRIDALDTIGFLYELTTALAINRVDVVRMEVDFIGRRVHDTLFVTDSQGSKITDPNKQRELSAAITLVKHFTHLLPHSPDPESALLHFREFLGQLFDREDWSDQLASLERPEVLDALARLLGVSNFLWEDFLRMQHGSLFSVVSNVEELTDRKPRLSLESELQAELGEAQDGTARRASLNSFKDRHIFRVDMRHILGHIDGFEQFSRELTDLAEVVVNAGYLLCDDELIIEHGTPSLDNGMVCPVSICALGKCGGRELGYASDIELIFIYAGNGLTTGPNVITNSEYYNKLVHEFVSSIRTKREGIFEVDLQLRPYGSAGSMAVVLESFQRYFAPGGPAWAYERQALVKLRPIAGTPELGDEVIQLRDDYVYGGVEFDVSVMRAMRERQARHFVTAGTLNVKFSPGGLVDVEYMVQGLQIAHGQEEPGLRTTNTSRAMALLHQTGILSADDYQCLSEAHNFLRQVINALRVVRGHAKDMTVPRVDSEEFRFLARRLQYVGDLAKLRDDLLHHTSAIQEIIPRLFD